MIKYIFLFLFFVLFTFNIKSEPNLDQWKDSEKTYYDLIKEGFEIKAYDISSINIREGNILIFFVTVLQKNNIVYECQEYQTLDMNLSTLEMNLICRKLVQPYFQGLGA
tara:strand:- start:3485 stop:3811 length:327 start_codon:yes stop_codon:yes gene_type:complete